VRDRRCQAVAGAADNIARVEAQPIGGTSDSVAGNCYRESSATKWAESTNPLESKRNLLPNRLAPNILNSLISLSFLLPPPIEREGFIKILSLYLTGGVRRLRKLELWKGSKNDDKPEHRDRYQLWPAQQVGLPEDRPSGLRLLAREPGGMPQRGDRTASPANRLAVVRDHASGIAAAGTSAPMRSGRFLGADSASPIGPAVTRRAGPHTILRSLDLARARVSAGGRCSVMVNPYA
jgi:hypothetical protein